MKKYALYGFALLGLVFAGLWAYEKYGKSAPKFDAPTKQA